MCLISSFQDWAKCKLLESGTVTAHCWFLEKKLNCKNNSIAKVVLVPLVFESSTLGNKRSALISTVRSLLFSPYEGAARKSCLLYGTLFLAGVFQVKCLPRESRQCLYCRTFVIHGEGDAHTTRKALLCVPCPLPPLCVFSHVFPYAWNTLPTNVNQTSL